MERITLTLHLWSVQFFNLDAIKFYGNPKAAYLILQVKKDLSFHLLIFKHNYEFDVFSEI